MLWLILGIIFCFLGGCNVVQVVGQTDENVAVGGTVVALFFLILGIPMFVVGVKKLSSPTGNYTTIDLKECPFCAERIQRKAKICRYCGRDLNQGKNEAQ